MRDSERGTGMVLVVATLVAAIAASCSLASANTIGLPSEPSAPPGQPELCPAARHVPFTLAADASASPPVWGVGAGGERFEITWPFGFRARFTLGLEVLDGSGNVVARGGEVISGAGGGSAGAGEYLCSFGSTTY